jgi:hypothetical protein
MVIIRSDIDEPELIMIRLEPTIYTRFNS